MPPVSASLRASFSLAATPVFEFRFGFDSVLVCLVTLVLPEAVNSLPT